LKWAAEGLGKVWARDSTNTVSITIAQDVLTDDDNPYSDKQLAGLSASYATLLTRTNPNYAETDFKKRQLLFMATATQSIAEATI